MRATVEWKPLSDLPAELHGTRLLLWLDEGEKGNGEVAVGMIFPDIDGRVGGYWTWGGPNSGYLIEEVPTMYARIPYAPDGSEHD